METSLLDNNKKYNKQFVMKILIINSCSHTGSTGKIAFGAYNYLRQLGNDVKICCRGARENEIDDNDIINLESNFEYYLSNIFSRVTGLLGYSNYRQTKKIYHIIDSFKPDIVQLYNLHGFYVNDRQLIQHLKEKNIPALYTMFDEYAYMGRCCFSLDCNQFQNQCGKCPMIHLYPHSCFLSWAHLIQQEKKMAYKGYDNLYFAGVKWVCERAKSSSLLKDREIFELDEPINYEDVFFPRDTTNIKQELCIQESQKVIVMVGEAAVKRKGGIYFVELARKFEGNKDFVFVYVGYNRNDWDIPSNMITFGLVYDQDKLAEFYSLADLFVCTSLADTTPNTCLDAMGCGSPILGFQIAGVPYCANEPIGKFVEAENVEALANEVAKVEKKTPEVAHRVREYAYNRFAEKNVFSKQVDIYNRILGAKEMNAM